MRQVPEFTVHRVRSQGHTTASPRARRGHGEVGLVTSRYRSPMSRSSESSFLIAGLDPSEVLQLPPADLRELLLVDRAILFEAGTAEVLAQLTDRGSTLCIELAQIDGGGEGVLPVL